MKRLKWTDYDGLWVILKVAHTHEDVEQFFDKVCKITTTINASTTEEHVEHVSSQTSCVP